MINETLRVATFPDGSQVLIREWDRVDGRHVATAAIRPDKWATWGPPAPLEVAP